MTEVCEVLWSPGWAEISLPMELEMCVYGWGRIFKLFKLF